MLKLQDSIAKYLYPKNHYPIMLLNTRDWSVQDILSIRSKWRDLDILFHNIYPLFNSIIDLKKVKNKEDPHYISYVKMCSLFWEGITRIRPLRRFKYLMRLDDDACFRDFVNYNLFEEMSMLNASYAYHSLFLDPANVVVGLDDFAADYMRENKLEWSNKPLRSKLIQLHSKGRV